MLDTAAARVLALLDRALAAADPTATYDADAHHALAREAAARGTVLLKTEGGVPPLPTTPRRYISTWPRRPAGSRPRRRGPRAGPRASRAWTRWAQAVSRRRWVAAGAGMAVVLALALAASLNAPIPQSSGFGVLRM